MIGTLYLITMGGAAAIALHQTNLIKANRPIHHKMWLTIYVVIGVALAWMDFGTTWWSLLALVGMAGIFSNTFRTYLNALRGLLPSYMGPNLSDTSAKRSQYDLLMWRIAARLKWRPFRVAQLLELGTALILALVFTFIYHP